jgi:hypothetical protein
MWNRSTYLALLNRVPASLPYHPKELVLPVNPGTLGIQQRSETSVHNDPKCKFIKINLHYSMDSMALLCRKPAKGETDVILIQELWVYGDHCQSSALGM